MPRAINSFEVSSTRRPYICRRARNASQVHNLPDNETEEERRERLEEKTNRIPISQAISTIALEKIIHRLQARGEKTDGQTYQLLMSTFDV